MLVERIEQIRRRIVELVARYEAAYPGQKVPHINLQFDLRGRAAGMAGYQLGRYFIRFNTDMMQNQSWQNLFNDTVPHELAHVICMSNGSDHGHGLFWRRTCQWLGGSGKTCHTEKTVYAKGKTYAYKIANGTEVHLSAARHRRVQMGFVYRFQNQNIIDLSCPYRVI